MPWDRLLIPQVERDRELCSFPGRDPQVQNHENQTQRMFLYGLPRLQALTG